MRSEQQGWAAGGERGGAKTSVGRGGDEAVAWVDGVGEFDGDGEGQPVVGGDDGVGAGRCGDASVAEVGTCADGDGRSSAGDSGGCMW